MKVIDIKKEKGFIEQYVNLRNSHADLLLTSAVTVSLTKQWLDGNDVELRGLVQDDVLSGAAILYPNKNGEIAFFAKYPNSGIGSRLLEIIEEVAKERKLGSIWAWVLEDNSIARHVFEKSGFAKIETCEREHKCLIMAGVKYEKTLCDI